MKILIADDHALVRQGLITILTGFEDATFVEAENGEDVLTSIQNDDQIGIVLLDLFMPGDNPFDLIRQVRAARPDIPLIVISGSEDPADMRRSLDHGASGFICKSAAKEILISAIRLVMSGGIYVPPELVGRPSADGARPAAETLAAAADSVPSGASPFALTPRQQQVLKLIIKGQSNKEIAAELEVSDNTVKIHVASILRTLGVTNRTKAARVAQAAGFHPDADEDHR